MDQKQFIVSMEEIYHILQIKQILSYSVFQRSCPKKILFKDGTKFFLTHYLSRDVDNLAEKNSFKKKGIFSFIKKVMTTSKYNN